MIVSKTAPIKLDITRKMKQTIWEVKLTSVFVGLFIGVTYFRNNLLYWIIWNAFFVNQSYQKTQGLFSYTSL